MSKAKPFEISRHMVWEAYQRVKANKGSAGVDGESMADFESNLKDNLYKLWNRMSSGSYFPLAVKQVMIPKASGGQRPLGIPTISDRIAQTVVKLKLEPELDPHFHPDSYGYRPGKSAIEAVGITRKRCWRYNWVIDLDIQGFFDNLDRELLKKALKRHTDCRWVLLYIERWLHAPIQRESGEQICRTKGCPQGGVISPLLANLYLHYTFDEWMRRNYPHTPFARYADDSVVHCKTEREAQELLVAIRERMKGCGLKLHPEKSKIVYCKDDDRQGSYLHEQFDFLGYTFRSRRSKNRWGKFFINFSPSVSRTAMTQMRRKMRTWKLHLRTDKELIDLSRMFNPTLRGWVAYFQHYYPSGMYPVLRHVNRILARWARGKFKRLRRHKRRAEYWLGKVARAHPELFCHWQMGLLPPAE